MISKLIGLLRDIGLDPTAEEVADMVWLASLLPESHSTVEDKKQQEENSPSNTPPPSSNDPSQRRTGESSQQTTKSDNDKVDLYSTATNPNDITEGVSGGLPFRSPGTHALPGKLAMGRALRPLKKRVPSRTRFVLNEEATVERIADENNWIPVLKPAPRRWLDVDIVVDESTSMIMWGDAIAEFQKLLEGMGAFRQIRSWGIQVDRITKQVSLHVVTGAKKNKGRHPRELIDPRGERLVLVVSDCTSPVWYDGAMGKMLHIWGTRGMLAIVQVLPQSYWQRTALGATTNIHLRSRLPGTRNVRLNWELQWLAIEKMKSIGTPIPITTMEPHSLTALAQLITGRGSVWVPGTLFPNGGIEFSHEPLTSGNAQALLDAFQQASPEARELAGYLAAVPLTLPIMHLVRRVMLPKSHQVHLAEIFFNGLIIPQAPVETNDNPDDKIFDFVPGLRELLVRTVPADKTISVIEKVSQFVNKETGMPLSFNALLSDPTLVNQIEVPAGELPYAKLKISTLQQLGGNYAALAQRIKEHLQYKPEKQETKISVASRINDRSLQETDALLDKLMSEADDQELSNMLEGLKRATVQFGDPRNNLIPITADQLHNSGIDLSSIQRQQLEGQYEFYFMTVTVDMRTKPGTHFSALACELNFGPEGKKAPIVQSIFPQTSWKNVMSFGGGMNLGLDANLNWKVGVDTSRLSQLVEKAPELQADLENKNDMKSFVVLRDFAYDLGRFDIAAYGKDSSECYWYIQNTDLQQTLTVKFSIVFKVPAGTKEITLHGLAWAEPTTNWLTTSLRDAIDSRLTRLHNPFSQEQIDTIERSLARGTAENWRLALPQPRARFQEFQQTSLLSTNVLTNLAADILKHRSQSVTQPMMVRALKWAGFRDPDFEEKVQDALEKSLQLFFEQHEHYRLQAIVEFFGDATTAQQIADYVLDGQPVDVAGLQTTLDNYLQKQTIARLLLKKRDLDTQQVVPELLNCYRRVLSRQMSLPQMALMWQILDQREQMLAEMKASEERLKLFIRELRETTLTPEKLQAQYQAGQQEVAQALVEEVTDAGMLQADTAEQAIAARLRPLPALFSDGLCAGRPLRPAPHQYFVSHGFYRETLADWRETLAAALVHAAGATEPLQPYFAGDAIMAGYKLCAISEKICATRFSTFLLPPSQDRNVYLELGIAIGLGVPFLLIQHYQAEIPAILHGLGAYTRGGLLRRMQRELVSQVETYDFGVVRFVRPQTVVPDSTYLLATGDLGMEDEDFTYSIQDALKANYPQLRPVRLNEPTVTRWSLNELVEKIQASRFAIYRVDEHCSPTTFLALGISIGLSRPFLMVHHTRSKVPENLRGIGIQQFTSYVGLEKEFVASCRTFLEKYGQTNPVTSSQTMDTGQRSSRIPVKLYQRLQKVLADCDQFSTDQRLRTTFAHSSLSPWRDNLPQADTLKNRVDATIAYLYPKFHVNGSNGLVILLQVLSWQFPAEDNQHWQLESLASELETILSG
jgi:hypothetical protein